MTPRELYFYTKGHYAAHDAKTREILEWTRVFATVIIRPHLQKDVRPDELVKFPWDKKRYAPADISNLKEQLQKFARRLKNDGKPDTAA